MDPRNSRVLVTSATNDTLWVLDVIDEAGSSGGCEVLELQVMTRSTQNAIFRLPACSLTRSSRYSDSKPKLL